MLTFFNAEHHRHRPAAEMFRGQLVPSFEVPDRCDRVLHAIQARQLGPVERPGPVDESPIARVHAPRYLSFLEGAWDEWVQLDPAHAARDAIASYWPIRGFRSDVLPQSFHARLGLFSYDAGTPLTAGSWAAAREGARCALAAAAHVGAGARAAFVLSRPPGHHAGPDFFGGYCFLNNAAIAAEALRQGGARRVAVLDIDYHHGNGTQSIFYERADVLVASVHGDPLTEYPYFLGHADERGAGAGVGANLNLPLPRGTGYEDWRAALQVALDAVRAHAAEALVVSLGVDTFEHDPIAGFRLRSPDYLDIGRAIATLDRPSVFVFEGGYAVEDIGINVAHVLEGFERFPGRA